MDYGKWQKENEALFKQADEILKANEKNAELEEMLAYIKEMQESVKQSSEHISKMETQIADMKEIQKHPVKNILTGICENLKGNLEKAKEGLKSLMDKVVAGCKKIVEAGKDNVALINGALTEMSGEKQYWQNEVNANKNIIQNCEKAEKAIGTFVNEKVAAGVRNIQNAGRALAGKTDRITTETKSFDKAVAALSAPFKLIKTDVEQSLKFSEKQLARTESYLNAAEAVREYRDSVKQEKRIVNAINDGEKKSEITAAEASELRTKSAERVNDAKERKDINMPKKPSMLDKIKASTAQAKQNAQERDKQKERARAVPEV